MPPIRVVAMCVFRRESQILVGRGFDDVKRERFFRPLGGAVEFGETAAEAVRREIREELRAEISDPVLLGVLESVFTYAGRKCHECVFVFDARFEDGALYAADELELHEEGWVGAAVWLDLAEPTDAPLYPEGLRGLLVEAARRA